MTLQANNLDKAKEAMQDIYANPELTARQKRRLVNKLRRPHLDEIAKLEREENRLNHQRVLIEQAKVALDDFVNWSKGGEITLQKLGESGIHKLADAVEEDRTIWLAETPEYEQEVMRLVHDYLDTAQTFVVQHDWAAAFKNAQDFDGEVSLPYEKCAFEFRMNGYRLIAFVHDFEKAIFAMEADGCWVVTAIEDNAAWVGFILGQIRAICIALDAEVAESEVIRAPHRLNMQREKKGKTPLYDYRIVSLTKRHRIKGLGEPTGAKKRLHFRRGHWRHFETHKTWIKWMLVGSPDLGFIDKEYRL